MSHSVIFDEKVLDFIANLQADTRERILDKISEAKENPHHFFERLSGRPDFKLRVGDYRLIADIDDAAARITFTYIAHRKSVYKKI
ncbi:MAG: type II toxin-antitoxin system RelE/ParE family toxin [Candidatus Micrarchaeota archaeon]